MHTKYLTVENDLGGKCRIEFQSLHDNLSSQCAQAFKEIERKCEALVLNTNVSCKEAFAQVRMALESFRGEINQKCLQDFQNNTKASGILESKLVEKLEHFSQGIRSLQSSVSSLEQKIDVLEASRFSQAKENDFLKTNIQTLNFNFQVLWEKFSILEKAEHDHCEQLRQEISNAKASFKTLQTTVHPLPPLANPATVDQNKDQLLNQMRAPISIPITVCASKSSPPTSSNMGRVHAISGERLKLSESPSTRTPFLTPLMLASANIGLRNKFSGKKSD